MGATSVFDEMTPLGGGQWNEAQADLLTRLDAAKVQPPAAPPGCLACLATDLGLTIALVIPEEPEGQSPAASVLRFDSRWPDPVAAVLMRFDLWSAGHGISIGGCS